MKNKLMKISFCMVSVFVILVSMCPISAFANPSDSNTYSVFSSKPNVTDNSGYIELLFEDKETGYRWVTVFSYSYTPGYLDDIYSSEYSFSLNRQFTISTQNLHYNFRSNGESVGFVSFVCVVSYGAMEDIWVNVGGVTPDNPFTGYVDFGDSVALIGYHVYGGFDYLNGSNFGGEDFYVLYNENAVFYSQFSDLISSLNSLIDITGSESYKDELDTIISSLNSFEGSFEEFEEYYKTQMTEILRLTNSVLDKFNTLIENTDDIELYLENTYYLLDEMRTYLFDIWFEQYTHTSELQAVNQKLQSILDILNQKTDTEFTTQDPTQFDEYYDVENSLLDNDNVNVSDVVNVEVNQNALTVIWDYVERALNSHGKVFGMVLTILALGIIALILGR